MINCYGPQRIHWPSTIVINWSLTILNIRHSVGRIEVYIAWLLPFLNYMHIANPFDDCTCYYEWCLQFPFSTHSLKMPYRVQFHASFTNCNSITMIAFQSSTCKYFDIQISKSQVQHLEFNVFKSFHPFGRFELMFEIWQNFSDYLLKLILCKL